MKLLGAVLMAVVLAFAAQSLAHARTPNETALIERAIARGKLIHDLDQAAWRSTDLLLKALPKARHGEIRGWVVEPGEGGWAVLY